MMKSIFFAILCTTTVTIAYAHSGVILSVPSQIETDTASDGTEIVTIRNNLIPKKEIEATTQVKRFLAKKYGNKALQWPIMLQLKAGEAQVFNEELGKYFKVHLSELPKE